MADAGAEKRRNQSRGPRSANRKASPAKHREEVANDFYGSALDAAERIELQEASKIKGLDQEIAVLRMKLRKMVRKRRQNVPLMLRGIELLVKAVSARYRLSKEAEENLSESLANVVRGVGGLLMPEAFVDE